VRRLESAPLSGPHPRIDTTRLVRGALSAPLALLLLVAVSGPSARAAGEIRIERVHLAKGATSAVVEGTIVGYQAVDYVLGAAQGQHMNVSMATNKTATYFNILAPGETEVAFFNGSTSENQYEGVLPGTGDYRIRVYMMRSAARRNEKANYRLEMIVTGKPHASATGTAPAAGKSEHFDATCKVCKDGETKQGQSGPCTFSQRQGYIDLDLRNGETYSLSPTGQPNQFKDQKGKKVVVTFGGSTASGGGAAGAIAVADMGRYCAGETSAKFKVSPRDITTQNPSQTKGMWEIWGQYPAEPSPQVFICSFNAERQFLSVDKYQPWPCAAAGDGRSSCRCSPRLASASLDESADGPVPAGVPVLAGDCVRATRQFMPARARASGQYPVNHWRGPQVSASRTGAPSRTGWRRQSRRQSKTREVLQWATNRRRPANTRAAIAPAMRRAVNQEWMREVPVRCAQGRVANTTGIQRASGWDRLSGGAGNLPTAHS
jgi:hypothetical protein